MRKLLFALCAMVFTSGCAFQAQKATLAPTLTVAPSTVGSGTSVALRVVDERPSKSLGRRGTAYGAAAEITTDQDVAALIHEKVKRGLARKGFSVIDQGASEDSSLTLELRAFEYSTAQGFWTGGVNIDGAIKAIAVRDGDTYERMYRTDDEHRVVVVPTAEQNNEWMNTSLSDLLTQVFEDVGLFRFLAQPPVIEPVEAGN